MEQYNGSQIVVLEGLEAVGCILEALVQEDFTI